VERQWEGSGVVSGRGWALQQQRRNVCGEKEQRHCNTGTAKQACQRRALQRGQCNTGTATQTLQHRHFNIRHCSADKQHRQEGVHVRWGAFLLPKQALQHKALQRRQCNTGTATKVLQHGHCNTGTATQATGGCMGGGEGSYYLIQAAKVFKVTL